MAVKETPVSKTSLIKEQGLDIYWFVEILRMLGEYLGIY
jgi:hypothetical protein